LFLAVGLTNQGLALCGGYSCRKAMPCASGYALVAQRIKKGRGKATNGVFFLCFSDKNGATLQLTKQNVQPKHIFCIFMQ